MLDVEFKGVFETFVIWSRGVDNHDSFSRSRVFVDKFGVARSCHEIVSHSSQLSTTTEWRFPFRVSKRSEHVPSSDGLRAFQALILFEPPWSHFFRFLETFHSQSCVYRNNLWWSFAFLWHCLHQGRFCMWMWARVGLGSNWLRTSLLRELPRSNGVRPGWQIRIRNSISK